MTKKFCVVCKDNLSDGMIDATRFREVKGRRIVNICGGCMDDIEEAKGGSS